MYFGRVTGTVVCTAKVPSWRGHRLLLLQPTDPHGAAQGRMLVAVDLVSAAHGQRVFYVRGREAANALPDPDNPADAAIVGIVDDVRIETASPSSGSQGPA
jgi:ethanolamine utilization protein EutN